MKVLHSLKSILTIFGLGIFLIALLGCQSGSNDHPAGKKTEKWSFVAFGDSRGDMNSGGVNVDILGKLAVAVANENPEFVLFPGDQIFGHANRKELGDEEALKQVEAQLSLWLETMKPIYDKGIPVYNVRGNHEVTQRNPNHEGFPDHRPIWPRTKEPWDKVFSGKYAMPNNGPEGEKNVTFSAIHHNALIIGLDAYSTPPGTPTNPDGSIQKPHFHRVNNKWLAEQLAANKQPHIFTFEHEPAFKIDHDDCLHGNDAYGLDHSAMRDSMWNSLKKAGARVFFCCHDHGYARARIDDGDGNPDNDLYQLDVATAGAGKNINPKYGGYTGAFKSVPLVLDNSYGYMLVEVEGLKATFMFKRMADEENSTFEISEVFSYTLEESLQVKK